MVEALRDLHSQIDRCTICSNFVVPLRKPQSNMARGEGPDIFVVGQAPGKTEVSTARAFSGSSGTRLDNWLIACGRPAGNPRLGVYLTSVLKCPVNLPAQFKLMARNCRHFLDSQIEIIRPKIVITLGLESFEYLKTTQGNYDSLIGQIFYPNDNPLSPPQPFSALVHWPHPSGLNRWHNGDGNGARLEESFKKVKAYLKGDQ